MKNLHEKIIKYRSSIGLICLIIVLYFAQPSPKSVFFGFFFIIAGMFFRGWASGYINKDNELATRGPYALTRNPLYFGNFILGIGIAIAGNNIYSYVIFILFYATFFPFLMTIEHKRLKKKFGQKYEEWAKGSNSFFPKIKKVDCRGYNISYYMKNREYQVLYFSLFIIAVMILKVLNIIRH
ncbi:MAG: isoprenylcysteine carboxylmethyltransferase family protein [Acidobacteria bacterium]|nr:isoprenylcysteine carboxylmethyltransferase family protein [Acidobacteriota bacterium]